MRNRKKGNIDYRLFEMLKGNDKYKLSFEELKRIRKKDIIETILEFYSVIKAISK